ncbi:MAG TPA: YicC family protein [Bacteroidales bacterium]|nr:YicC family protein [Bacteroidales bacterium]
MTGFGHTVAVYQKKQITVDIKCLNSKSLDLNIRIPNFYREIEFELRAITSKQLSRGKIDLSLNIEWLEPPIPGELNKTAFIHYYNSLQELKSQLQLENYTPDWFSTLVRMPDVVNSVQQKLDEEEKKFVIDLFNQAIFQVLEFRKKEAHSLITDIVNRVQIIDQNIDKITPFERQRIENIKQRIIKNLSEISTEQNYDSNRFEQELIYYLEKLDITEEKVRLRNHCNYFIETIQKEEQAGRKLSFISQEMGREINTLGSKAQDTDIQKFVVEMKDELEKIKEQLLNIL